MEQALLGLVAAAALLAVYGGVPWLLRTLGFQPRTERPPVVAHGKRALVVTTSCAQLGEGGRRTGVAAFEMTGPYYAFADAGMAVDLASIAGGPIPIEPQSLRWPFAHPADRRFLKDPGACCKLQHSLPIAQVDFSDYDIVFVAGGWGAAYDLADSESLGRGITAAWAAGTLIGSVCHGGLGLLRVQIFLVVLYLLRLLPSSLNPKMMMLMLRSVDTLSRFFLLS